MTWNGTWRFQSMRWLIVSRPNSTGIARSRTASSNAFVPTRSTSGEPRLTASWSSFGRTGGANSRNYRGISAHGASAQASAAGGGDVVVPVTLVMPNGDVLAKTVARASLRKKSVR